MANQTFSRTNLFTGEIKYGSWDELCDLDSRQWTPATGDYFGFSQPEIRESSELNRIFHHTRHFSARLAVAILKSYMDRMPLPLWVGQAIRRAQEAEATLDTGLTLYQYKVYAPNNPYSIVV